MARTKNNKYTSKHNRHELFFESTQRQRQACRFDNALRKLINRKHVTFKSSQNGKKIILITPIGGVFEPVHGKWKLDDGSRGCGLESLLQHLDLEYNNQKNISWAE